MHNRPTSFLPPLPSAASSSTPESEASEQPLWHLQELQEILGGEWIVPPSEKAVATGVNYYSSQVEPGDMVFTTGPDAWRASAYRNTNEIIPKLFKKGAAVVIADQMQEGKYGDKPLLLVENTRRALDMLGKAARDRMTGTVVAITGSAGKTTSKELTRFLLSRQGTTKASRKNYNHGPGVSLMLSDTPAKSRFGVYEFAVDMPNTTKIKAQILRPHVVLITSIYPDHLHLYKTLENLTDQKCLLFKSMERGGTAVLNRDSNLFDRQLANAKAAGVERFITFGAHQESDMRLIDNSMNSKCSKVRMAFDGQEKDFQINEPGIHMVMNCLGALAVVHASGGDWIQAATDIKLFKGMPHRNETQIIQLQGGTATLIDDTFSANPASAEAGLSVLGLTDPEKGGRRIAVMGSIKELGKTSAQLHAGLAPHVLDAKVDVLFTIGKEMANLWLNVPEGFLGLHGENPQLIANAIKNELRSGDIVWIKGSMRSASNMELIISTIKTLEVPPEQKRLSSTRGSKGPRPAFIHTTPRSLEEKESGESRARNAAATSDDMERLERSENIWTRSELIDATGGEFVNDKEHNEQFGGAIFPFNHVRPGSIVFHVDPADWPSRYVRFSGQSGISLDKVMAKAHQREAALVISSKLPKKPSPLPILLVANSYEALFALANYSRARFEGRFIAITGTAGKSSTKVFLGELLQKIGLTTASFGNWNTVEGVAMLLANLPADAKFAVAEVSEQSIQGHRKRSSLDFIRHDDAIITSIGIDSTNTFPTPKVTAEVVSKLFSTLPVTGRAYWPLDIAESELICSGATGKQSRVIGDPEQTTITVQQIESGFAWTRVKVSTEQYSEEVTTSIIGTGSITNIALAAQCAYDLGVPAEVISKCIGEHSLSQRKMELVRLNFAGKSVEFLDDCHNANLSSFGNSLKHISQAANDVDRLILIIGRIFHIEGNESEIYGKLAHLICDCKPLAVILHDTGLDELAKSLEGKARVLMAPTPRDAVALVETLILDGSMVYLKGSSRNTRIRELSALLRTRGTLDTAEPLHKPRPLPKTVIESTEQPHRIERASTGEFSIGFAGDTYLGELYAGKKSGRRSNHPLCDGNYDSAFEHLDGFLHASNLNIANLETPLTLAAESPFDGMRPYLHWARPEETLSCLARHNIDVVTLANNHFYDYGQPGMSDTLAACDASSLIGIGAGRNMSEAARPLSIDIKMQSPQAKSETHHEVLVFNGFAYRKSLSERFASYAGSDNPGCFPLRGTSLVHAIRHARKLNDTALIIVLPHWQRDYLWASDRQRDFASAVLEAGADLVIGHGSHMMQQVERFGGKLAMHGIGNFVFNSAGRYAVKYAPRFSAAIRLIFPASSTDAPLLRLYPFLSCNRTTEYRPRFLTEEEFSEFQAMYCNLGFVPSDAVPAKDAIGLNLEFSLR